MYGTTTAHSGRPWAGSILLLPVCVLIELHAGSVTLLDTLSAFLYVGGEAAFGLVSDGARTVGGLLVPLLVPLAFVGLFARWRFCFGMQVFLVWLGHNLLYIGRFGPETADWPELLALLGLDPFDYLLWSGCMLLGTLAFVVALALPALTKD